MAAAWSKEKDTGAEVLLDMDFTTLGDQVLNNNTFNSIGGYDVYLTRNANSNVSIISGKEFPMTLQSIMGLLIFFGDSTHSLAQ